MENLVIAHFVRLSPYLPHRITTLCHAKKRRIFIGKRKNKKNFSFLPTSARSGPCAAHSRDGFHPPRRIGIIVWCNQHRDGEILQKALADLQISSVIYEAGQVLSAQEPCILLTPAPNTSLNYPCWTRDPFLFRATHGKTIRIHNSAVVHGDELLWSEHFLKKLSFDDHTAFSIAETPLPVAGGNLLADHHFVLVGTRQFRDFTRKQVAGESGYHCRASWAMASTLGLSRLATL